MAWSSRRQAARPGSSTPRPRPLVEQRVQGERLAPRQATVAWLIFNELGLSRSTMPSEQ